MTNLEMWASDGFCELMENGLLYFSELRRIHDFEDIFYFIEEHDFFGAVDFWPVSEKAENNLFAILATTRCSRHPYTHLFR